VERAGEDPRLVGEHGRGAVALVDVGVEHQHPLDPALGQEHRRRHRQIVPHAEPAAEGAVGVVGAASQVARPAVVEGGPGRRQRAAHRGQGSSHQRRRPRQPDPALGPLV
jgi:hypothetical protein